MNLDINNQLTDEDLAKMFGQNSGQGPTVASAPDSSDAPTDVDLAKSAATPIDEPASESFVKKLYSDNQPASAPTNFGDVINSFVTPKNDDQQPHGFMAGITKLGDYLATPEGRQLIGGLVSKQNPEAGLYMVNQAEKDRQRMLEQNAPISKTDKYKMAMEGAKNIDEVKQRALSMGIDWKKFMADMGIKESNLANETAKTEIERQNAAVSKQNADTDKARLGLENKKTEADIAKTGYEEKVKPILDTAKNMYDKGNLTEENYNKIVSNPYKYRISGNAQGFVVGKTRAPVEEGQLGVDANGKKAYKFKDGTFQEVQ